MTRLTTALVSVAGGLAVVACGSATASTTSNSGSARPSGRAGLRGAAGQLVQIRGTTLTVSGAGGDTTVTYNGSTTFAQTSTANLAEIAPGQCIVATGTKQAGGTVSVDTVRLSQPVNGSCAGGGFGFGPGGAPRSPRAGFTPPPQFANRSSVRGKVTQVSGTSVTVQPASGAAEAITVPTTVPVSIVNVVKSSVLQTGQCLLASGARSSSGTVSARVITIVPAGPSGCFTGRGGFGGAFGGFGGFGGGGPGARGGSSAASQ
jgi:hypothetical protein